eukprot:CAMPEP_0172446910 /NCGR_PEP_ID=MMETSP1065-20121228/6356_1 /TAXON_ID=265537 /ORGANISM="Amphiprora paludosa, Strain CCMP125" /LENGTH=441 /DNA_ID=CAMNT_0013198099 /DNA_START=47 /DNA_END=1372 /DNA_ORIENTATION=-
MASPQVTDATTIVEDAPATEVVDNSHNANSDDFTDETFEAWIAQELIQTNPPVALQYPQVFAMAPTCITHWRRRYHGNRPLWKRLFSKDRVCKEIVEAVPIIDGVLKYVERQWDLVYNRSNSEGGNAGDMEKKRIVIVDLCSGKGYLSMLLSEMIPLTLQAKAAALNDGDKNDMDYLVSKFILVDKQWPMHGTTELSPHHINWEHIYGSCPQTGQPYVWPIPLHTSKQDLKAGRVKSIMKDRLFDTAPTGNDDDNNNNNQQPDSTLTTPTTFMVLAVHLCGTLSLKAVDMFNENPAVQWFALKPCCLPPMVFVKRKEHFCIGQHEFDAALVCSGGRWKGNVWRGPPRHTLPPKFQAWAQHLFYGVDLGSINNSNDTASNDSHPQETSPEKQGDKCHVEVMVQNDGGYQNAFILAERGASGTTTLAPLAMACNANVTGTDDK